MRGSIAVLFVVSAAACTSKSETPPAAQRDSASVSASSTTETAISSTETAVAPEVNPPGDIPDSQAFVSYTNASGGYKLDVPEGWARTENATSVSFVNKFDGVKVDVAAAAAAPTAANVRANEAKAIQSEERAVTINSVSEVNLSGGRAVVIKYASNSEANPVTNKRVRLENETYLFFKNGKEAALTVWAPQGADNVDQWQRMAKSFRWL